MATTRQKSAGGIAAILAAILLALGINAANQQATPPATTTTSAPTTSTTSTTVVDPNPGAAAPWGSPRATWNRPVAEFGRARPELQQYAGRLYTYGGGPAPPGTFSTAFGDYSVPVYDAKDATSICRIYQTTASQSLYVMGFAGLNIGDPVPCNPAWKPGTGNDNIMAIVDYELGRVWEIGGVGQNSVNCREVHIPPFIIGRNAAAGFDPGRADHLCTMGGARWDGLYTFADDTGIDGRGMGQPKLALLTRADEVASGEIRHALAMTITNTMFGAPACTPTQGPYVPGFGVSCGGYVAPATKLERQNPNVGCAPQIVNDVERAKTIPEGMRFALDVTDADIESWLDSRGYEGKIRNTARVFAVALRDYGWIVAETGCWGMHIETDSVIGASGETWARLGILADGKPYPKGDLMTGLFTPERIYVVEPPA